MATHEVRRNYLIRNQTPYQVVLRSGGHSLTLAPLQSRRIGVDPMSCLGDVALAAHDDRVIDWEQEPLRSTRLIWATCLAIVGISAAVVGVGGYLLSGNLTTLAVGIAIAVLCAIGGAYSIGLMWLLVLIGLQAAGLVVVGGFVSWPIPVETLGVGTAMLCAIGLAYGWGYHHVSAAQTPPPCGRRSRPRRCEETPGT